jgi:predicted DNA-binding protein with PD1-like motif
LQSKELRLGRSFGVTFDHGDDFFTALEQFCRANKVHQAYVPAFIAGFKSVRLVGTCEKLEDPGAPVWSSVYLENAEALGSGTIAYSSADDRYLPHIHVAVGLKEHSAVGHTSHLLGAHIQFLTEMLVIEVAAPNMTRVPRQDLYDVPLLTFIE